ncbi:MAG: response regulator transcription factor [Desulfobacteraceae bacterium]|jgi:DNA-binding NarL/FixJ family response regulator
MLRNVKALIVEDNASFRRMLERILISKFPYMRIQGGPDGKQAFQKLDRHPADLIFMDIQLPGENGLVLTKKIKKKYPNAVIIILTNHDLPEYRDAAFKNGAEYFLSKESTKAEEILGLVESILAGNSMT